MDTLFVCHHCHSVAHCDSETFSTGPKLNIALAHARLCSRLSNRNKRQEQTADAPTQIYSHHSNSQLDRDGRYSSQAVVVSERPSQLLSWLPQTLILEDLLYKDRYLWRTQPSAMTMLGVGVALVVLGWTGLLYLFLNGLVSWLRTAWMLRKLPKGPGNLLFGGVVDIMASNRLRAFQRINDNTVNGCGVFYFNALWRQTIVVTDPHLMVQLLHNKALVKPVRPDYIRFRQLMGPAGIADLVTAESDANDWLWKTVRKGVAPAFAAQAMRAVYPQLAGVGRQLVQALSCKGEGQAVDMSLACMCETLDGLGMTGFNKIFHNVQAFKAGQAPEMLTVIRAANAEVARGLQNPFYSVWQKLPGPPSKGQVAITSFHFMMNSLLQELKARGQPGEEDSSIGAQLMRLKDPRTGGPLGDEYLLPQLSSLFWAGFDTTGNTMAWTLYCISQHPEVESKIAAELKAHGLLATPEQAEPRVPDYADLAKLTYLSCVIKESMRMHTVVGFTTARTSQHDLVLQDGKLVIPRDCSIFLPLGLPHMSSAIFPDPDHFLPERWLGAEAEYMSMADSMGKPGGSRGEQERVTRFMPFSEGRRQCIGMAFAKMNYTAILAMLLGNFSFRLAASMGGPEGVMAAQKYEITLTPSTGMWMHCHKRTTEKT